MAVRLEENGLALSLPSGEGYFNYYWLRDNDPGSIDPQTRERIFDVTELPGRPIASAARLDGADLVISWTGETLETRYPLETLDAWHRDGRRPDPARLPRRLFRAGAYDSWARYDQPTLDKSPAEVARFAHSLIVDGIALVTGMEDSDAGLTRLCNLLGPVTPSADGFAFDVRLEIKPTNLAYTARALELHTDLPSEEAAPGVQFLHCRRNSVTGGFSLFVDGAAVAEALRAESPAEFDLLAAHPIPFFRRHEGWDYRAHQHVIELDRDGQVSGVTVSQHLADLFDLPQRLLDIYYPAFCHFIRLLRDERFLNRFRLAPGECIVFDNHRIVHGREAFSATSGERHLRGCYIDRGALRSTYRTLFARGYRPDL
jgi:gamma-butyrobetaine dioxygenase